MRGVKKISMCESGLRGLEVGKVAETRRLKSWSKFRAIPLSDLAILLFLLSFPIPQ